MLPCKVGFRDVDTCEYLKYCPWVPTERLGQTRAERTIHCIQILSGLALVPTLPPSFLQIFLSSEIMSHNFHI